MPARRRPRRRRRCWQRSPRSSPRASTSPAISAARRRRSRWATRSRRPCSKQRNSGQTVMYNLHLTPEQIEIRDTVRDFGTREVKPVVLKSDRLDVRDRTLPMKLLDEASQMGLRTLALSEDAGGSGADHLTCCLVTEELAAADADFAAVLAETAWLAHVLFDQAMTEAQRKKFLPEFLDDHRCHLAFAGYEADVETRLGAHYHRAAKIDAVPTTTAVKAASGEWVVNGSKDCVANAPIAGLFAVLVQIPGRHDAGVVLVP